MVRELVLATGQSMTATATKSASQPGTEAGRRTVGELTKAVLGRELSLADALELLTHHDHVDRRRDHKQSPDDAVIELGSIGYERFRDSHDFARCLQDGRIECLVDVRELPISRRRGYAKSALQETLAEFSIEYRHMRGLGNPKDLRDLYKSGNVADGRRGYRRFLLEDRAEELGALAALLRETRCALMCVEHDQDSCHRDVIIEALQSELAVQLEVRNLGEA